MRIAPDQLRPHQRLDFVWTMAEAVMAGEDKDDWDAFASNVAEVGVLEAIKVVDAKGESLIVDGRNRWTAAMEAGLDDVPYELVTEAEGERLIESTIIGRRHLTKGQRAWIAVGLHPEVVGNQPGQPKKNSDSVGILSREALGNRFGVSSDLIDQAARLHEIFGKSEKVRKKHEPGIWAGQGLGAILAGLAGKAATEGSPRRPSGFDSADKAARSLASRLRLFGSWPEYEREIFRDTFGETLAVLDSGTRAVLREALAKADAIATEAEMEGGAE